MSNNTRTNTTTVPAVKLSLKSLNERLNTLEGVVENLLVHLTGKTAETPKAAKKAVAKKAAAKKATTKPLRVVLTAEEREALKVANKATAAWLRDNGVAVAGQAWAAAKAGERDVAALKALNVADGLDAIVAVAKKVAAPAKKATATKKAAAKIDLDGPAKTVDTAALKAAGLSVTQIEAALKLVG